MNYRDRLHEIIFESETRAGKLFDQTLIVAICLSVLTVILESVPAIRAEHGALLLGIEWFFTILFTFEYILRLIAVNQPVRYARSFFGIVDLMSILPTYLSLLFIGTQAFQVIRIFRLLRIFRIYKLAHYLDAAKILSMALKSSKEKIVVFLLIVVSTVVTMGSLLYWIEGPEYGFTSIPTGIYWAVVTMTTVGYGDISPQTPLGQTLAALLMVVGYGVIAVPTGIVSVEIAKATRGGVSIEACPNCGREGHETDAKFCRFCGSKL